ncbi:MAG: dTDP-4-amino-4,6-dideoxygalactose transaminase [Deltaproteobacteria bacterium]|nr:dTDP-4-amino-4,6-dideoxygalactose transaminase [Deltaproteobacteria bacterium]
MREPIPFNKPYLTGREFIYLAQALEEGHISGDGRFTRECSALLEERLGIDHVLMTNSGTAALELSVMLSGVRPGDEVIIPSFTFVTTATAIVRSGATPRFVDIRPDTLNLDERQLEAAIGPRTRAIIPVHYSSVACAMDRILEIAAAHRLRVIEDAAHAVNAFYRGRALGSIGDLGCFSFHETKNYISGEGGAVCINDPELVERARRMRDKGTDRHRFVMGLVDKYTWQDEGSSYAPSDMICAFLRAQLEHLDDLLEQRLDIEAMYRSLFEPLEKDGFLRLPVIPKDCRTNAHGFFVLLPDRATRDVLIQELADRGIRSAFHYIPLHSSPMGRRLGCDRDLPITDAASARLLRLPMFYGLGTVQIERIAAETDRILRRRGTPWTGLA